MRIETKYHGFVEIKEEDIYTFSNGIPGFSEEKTFTMLTFPENDVFFVMQSTVTPSLGFIVASPFTFFPDYDIQLDEAAVELLQLEKAEDAALYVVLTVRDPFDQTTANLQAPIVINLKMRQAKQVILNDNRYATRQLIMPAGAEKE